MLKLAGVIEMDEFYTNSGEKDKRGLEDKEERTWERNVLEWEAANNHSVWAFERPCQVCGCEESVEGAHPHNS